MLIGLLQEPINVRSGMNKGESQSTLHGACIFKMVTIDHVKIFCIFLFKNGYNINHRVFFSKLK